MSAARLLSHVLSLAALAATLAPSSAFAQQAGSDVGGQPARRKVTKMPRLQKFVEAEYPGEKKALGVEASVVLVIEISASGTVTRVTVTESAGRAFDDAAIQAVSQFEFEPAEVDDKPAPAKITYRYAFVLKKGDVATTAEAPRTAPPEPKSDLVLIPVQREAPTAPDEVNVNARPRARRESVQYGVRAEQARLVAGTQGDVLKVVQNLPGVSRPPVASGQIVVWGSAPRDTRVYVDGVDLPALYHGSGLRSTINSDLVASIDLVPGAFGAEYGRGLGGLVRVETRSLPRGTQGYIGVDTLDGSALVSTEITSHIRVAAAARYGWLDRLFPLTSAPDVSDYFPIPRYYDGQIKATIDLRRGEAIDAVFLLSKDELDRTVPSRDPAKIRSESTASGYFRAYARYTNVSREDQTGVVTPFVGQDHTRLVQRFGNSPANLDVTSNRYGLRSSLQTKIGSHVSLVTGLDALGTVSDIQRKGSLTLPAREGDISVFGQPPGDDLATDRWSTHILDVGPHAYADVKMGPVTFTPGVRFDAYVIEGSRRTPQVGPAPSIGFSRLETALAPRAAARWEVNPRLAFHAAYGTYQQPPDPEDLSAVFGTPDLELTRGTHATFGESLRITPTLSAEIVGFRKTMTDLVTRSRLPNPRLARSLTQNGEGRSYGVQFLLRQELWNGFFGWVSYAITRSERRYEDALTYRPFDFDQPHVLSIVLSQEIGKWTIGARFRYASGNPRTPVVGSSYDARNDRFDPVFGAQNSARIPSFWQLDARVERAIRLGETTRMRVFADVQNITNRENAEELVYSANFRKRDVIRGLPTIVVAGARLEF